MLNEKIQCSFLPCAIFFSPNAKYVYVISLTVNGNSKNFQTCHSPWTKWEKNKTKKLIKCFRSLGNCYTVLSCNFSYYYLTKHLPYEVFGANMTSDILISVTRRWHFHFSFNHHSYVDGNTALFKILFSICVFRLIWTISPVKSHLFM